MVPDQSQRLLGRYLMILAHPESWEVENKIIVGASSPRASLKPLYDYESLFSPTSRIIHIPEADDEDEDEDATNPFPETTTSRSSRPSNTACSQYDPIGRQCLTMEGYEEIGRIVRSLAD
ncbi:hypothetical protein ACE6H2_006045 [Prunus campanulata]